MVERRDLGSWLGGPKGPDDESGESDYPGERLGRPEHGPGSVGSFGRRLLGLWVDWALCLLIANAILGEAAYALFVLAVEHWAMVGTLGATIGHRVVGLRVQTVAGGHPGPGRALTRSVLLCLAVPPLIMDSDQRGLHDRAVGTLVVRG